MCYPLVQYRSRIAVDWGSIDTMRESCPKGNAIVRIRVRGTKYTSIYLARYGTKERANLRFIYFYHYQVVTRPLSCKWTYAILITGRRVQIYPISLYFINIKTILTLSSSSLNVACTLTPAILPSNSSGFLLILLLLHLLFRTQTTETYHGFFESKSRVEEVQRQAGDDDHNALKPNEQPLMPNQVPSPALAQLRNSVHASPEDADRGEGQGGHETLEFPAGSGLNEDGVLIEGVLAHGLVAPISSEGKIHTEAHENKKREDLERQPGNHDVVTRVRGLAGVRGGGGDSTTSSLKEKRAQIAGYELGRELAS